MIMGILKKLNKLEQRISNLYIVRNNGRWHLIHLCNLDELKKKFETFLVEKHGFSQEEALRITAEFTSRRGQPFFGMEYSTYEKKPVICWNKRVLVTVIPNSQRTDSDAVFQYVHYQCHSDGFFRIHEDDLFQFDCI